MDHKTLLLLALALSSPGCGTFEAAGEANAHLESADVARHDGDYDKAIAEYTEAIRGMPDAYYVYAMRGNAWRAKREYDRALADFNQAIELNPQSIAALNSRALTYAALRDFDRAIADYNRAATLARPPLTGMILQNRAAAWQAMGDLDRALADLDELIQYHGYNAASFTARGAVRSAKGEYDRAIADYDEAIRMDPGYGRAYAARAVARLAKGDSEGAIADMNMAASVNLRDSAMINGAAWWFATSKDDRVRNGKRAVELAGKACELTHWELPSYLDTLAAAYAEAGSFTEAVTWQEKALQSPGFAKFSGEGAQQRLQLYRAGKPYHAEQR